MLCGFVARGTTWRRRRAVADRGVRWGHGWGSRRSALKKQVLLVTVSNKGLTQKKTILKYAPCRQFAV